MSVLQTNERELTLAVVGIQYPNADKSNRRFEIELCAPGDPVDLRREPKNKYDKRAIAVFSERGIQIGYLTAERAPWIGAKLEGGEDWQAVFQGLEGRAAYIRIRFGGGAPVLPAPRQPAPEWDDHFQPDPVGSDWGA
jgi:hypothetical protein